MVGDKTTNQKPGWLRDATFDLRVGDQFGVDALADCLVQLIAGATPPFAVSMSGPWGVGKSTIADAVVKRLRAEGTKAVAVDAWTLDVEDLRRRIVMEVIAEIHGGSERDRIDAAKRLDDLRVSRTEVHSAHIEGRAWREISGLLLHSWQTYLGVALLVGASMYLAATLEGDSGIRPVFTALAGALLPVLAGSLVFKLVTPSSSRAPLSEDLALAREFKESVTTGVKDSRPVVIVVDNLDRLPGSDVLTALRQIRALVELDGSRCVFFVPIDRKRLAQHLADSLNDPDAATDYLEKFFSLDLQLTSPETLDLRDWAYEEVERLFGEHSEGDQRAVAGIAVSAAGRSPRTVRRVLNGVLTRQRALGDNGGVNLPQLALVEGLVTIAPGLVDAMASDASGFVEFRHDFGLGVEASVQMTALKNYLKKVSAGEQESTECGRTKVQGEGLDLLRLRQFLAVNSYFSLEKRDLLLSLTLRENRFWKCVADWEPLQQALDSGSTVDFQNALEGRESIEKQVVIERSVEHIQRYEAYSSVVAKALDAVAGSLPDYPRICERLRITVTASLSQAEARLLQSLSGQSVEFLFSGGRDDTATAALVGQLAKAIAQAEPGSALGNLIVGARLVAGRFSQQDLEGVRAKLATEDLEAQTVIFRDPISVILAEGPVADSMMEKLGSWDPAAQGQGRTHLLSSMLIGLVQAGWEGQNKLADLAAVLTPKLDVLNESDECRLSVDFITRLIALGSPGPELDAFGSKLAERRELNGMEVFGYSLRLPLQPPALAAVGSQMDGWMDSATSQRVTALVEGSQQRVEEALPSLGQVLLNRWGLTGDDRFAELAIGNDPGRLEMLQAKWDTLPGPVALERAVGALELSHNVGGRASTEDFLAAVNNKLKSLQFAEMVQLPSLVQWLVRRRYRREVLVQAIQDHLAAIPAAQELPVASSVVISVADILRGRQSIRLAESLADRFVVLNYGEASQVQWLLGQLAAQSVRQRLLVQLIERGPDGPAVLEVVSSARVDQRHVQVFEALVQGASRQTNESIAEAYLSEARRWPAPQEDSNSDAPAGLLSVIQNFPNLEELGKELVPWAFL